MKYLFNASNAALNEIYSEFLFGNIIFAKYAGFCRGLTSQECNERIVNGWYLVIVLSIWWIIQLQKIRWQKWRSSSNEPVKIRLVKWLKDRLPRIPTRQEREKMRKDFQDWLKLFLSPWSSKSLSELLIKLLTILLASIALISCSTKFGSRKEAEIVVTNYRREGGQVLETEKATDAVYEQKLKREQRELELTCIEEW